MGAQKLRVVTRIARAMVVTPYANYGSKIALTAWTGDPTRYFRNGYYGEGHLAACTKFDESASRSGGCTVSKTISPPRAAKSSISRAQ